ncbi:DinB family protein [uncultured Lutibacter sp.]|uniref:DinB family protein n=1 Tax=uncultured Lutibacter sp. TaxID=437739 RepID=UPI00261A1342|nr:DinB family protein [uncultured Lutibacter sp.]
MKAQNDVKSAFLLKWENSKNYLLEIAKAMPEANYNYKPTERQMSFQEQLIHIQGNMDWLSSKYFNGEKTEKIDPKSKEEIINQLTASFDNVAETIKKVLLEELSTEVEFFAGPKSKLQILNLLQDHVTHHRGQLIVYLNLNTIEPPKYRGW